MFLLKEEEKISFLRTIYNAIVFDGYQNDKEKEILKSLQEDVFNIKDFPRTDFDGNDDMIIEEINSINKIIPVIYLFNMMYDLEKYYKLHKKDHDRTYYKKEYMDRIDKILKQSKWKKDITSSSLFHYKNRHPPDDAESPAPDIEAPTDESFKKGDNYLSAISKFSSKLKYRLLKKNN